VGSTITLNGSNYKPGSSLTVKLDTETVHTSGSCTANSSGNVSGCLFTVPAATAGDHTMTVSDSSYAGTYTFTVTPAMSLNPSAGPAASTATVSGSGYAPFSTVTLTFGGSSATLTGPDGAPCTTDAQGSFSNCGYTIPVKPAGLEPVTASDGTNSGTYTYTVSPAFTLSPSEGPVGSSAAANGTGYTAYAPITVTVDGSSVTAPCQANSSGRMSGCSFTVPALSGGEHTVKVSDGTSSATATYTVDPSLSLIGSSAGAPGTSLTVRGFGFVQGTVDVTFDGTTVGTCDANGDGTFTNCTFTVPATAAAGPHIVAATDKKGYSASAQYNI
jgi:hypothetical protein